MPINASPHFEKAQAEYEAAQTREQRITLLKKMISLAPKHKGAENLRKQLKRRLAKLKYVGEKESKRLKSSGKKGIKKDDMQAAIIGKTDSRKGLLLSKMTNVKSEKISEKKFSEDIETKIGMIGYPSGAQIQLIEIPGIDSRSFDKGLANSADILLIFVKNLHEIEKIESSLSKAQGKKIIVFDITDFSESNEKRKISATLKSKRYNFVLVSLENSKEGLDELKQELLQRFDKIRVYTKEPGGEKSKKPIILEKSSTVKDVAEKILKGFSEKIKTTKIWGPSSKFSGQVVGLNHKLKDLDVVEFKTR